MVLPLCNLGLVFGHCWKPNSTPFYGAPKVPIYQLSTNSIALYDKHVMQVTRQNDRVRVEWSSVFNDGPDCAEVDFLIMIHPKNQPSAYTLSDFTLKGERKATLKINSGVDYVVQVIAREDKGDLGIDYKYSDMVTATLDGQSSSYTSSGAGSYQSVESTTRKTFLTPQVKSLVSPSFPDMEPLQFEENVSTPQPEDDAVVDATPWYIYECVPFIKDIQGYDESSGSENKLLESFIKEMNKKPLEMVDEFITKDKERCPSASSNEKSSSKGYLKRCNDSRNSGEMCCNSPWSKNCDLDCYLDYSPCDGNRCIPGKWVQDGWPDCLDGTDENPKAGHKSLPEQLVCIQCAGVILSAGFVCREARMGLTSQCIQNTLGSNGACNNCVSYYFNLN